MQLIVLEKSYDNRNDQKNRVTVFVGDVHGECMYVRMLLFFLSFYASVWISVGSLCCLSAPLLIKSSTVPSVPPRLLCCHLCHLESRQSDVLTTEKAVRWQKTLVCFTLLLSDHGGLRESSVTGLLVCHVICPRVSVCADG